MTPAGAPACQTPACIACAGQMAPLFEKMFDDRYGYPGYYDVFQCPNCLQSQTFPLLKDEELAGVYSRYYPRKSIKIQELVDESSDPLSRDRIRARWREGTSNQGQYLAQRGMTVLDYGCGAGGSLLEMRNMGIDAYGIEADANVQQVVDSLGLRIHIGTIEEAPYQNGQFDLIILNQVIEHLPDPSATLSKLEKFLKPGGRMALSFPNARSIYARAFGRKWINWHIPYHLHHFNASSMRIFFARHGWEVLKSRTITPNIWTYLQFRVAPEVPEMGRPQQTWTQSPTDDPASYDFNQMPFLLRKLRPFVMKFDRSRLSNNALIATNRLIDRLHLGDSFLVEIVRAPAEK